MIVWGKRTYGAVNKVGNVAVKTMFGHLYFLPLIPMGSYYFVDGSDSAFELKRINWRSAFCAYVRVWGAVALLLAWVGFQGAEENSGARIVSGLIMLAAVLAFSASYALDKKYKDKDGVEVRFLMERYFGVAVDPYECASSLQREITEKMQSMSAVRLEETWYKRTLSDSFSPAAHVELALLRARCDQHDEPLQGAALQKLQGRRKTI